MRPNRTSVWKVMSILICRELPLFNFERLDILCTWIRHLGEKLWPFEFSRSSVVQFRASWYIMRLNRTFKWKVMTIWISRELPLFNFELLDILCAWIGLPSEIFWPFEFLESFRCSISSDSIYYASESDFQVKCYDHLNLQELSFFIIERLDILYALIGHLSKKLWPLEFTESFIVQFQVSRFIMSPNRASVWKVMTTWIL